MATISMELSEYFQKSSEFVIAEQKNNIKFTCWKVKVKEILRKIVGSHNKVKLDEDIPYLHGYVVKLRFQLFFCFYDYEWTY